MESSKRKTKVKREIKGKVDLDWTEKGVVNPVIDQKRCTACWAICVLATIEAAYKIQNPNKKLMVLSIQQLIDCVLQTEDECYTYTIRKAFKWIQENGVSSEEDYGLYVAKKLPCRGQKSKSRAVSISNYENIDVKDDNALLDAVRRQPIAIEVISYKEFETYKGGIYWGPEAGSEPQAAHGLLLVGFGTDENGVNYWLAKNSWGESWGKKGYIKIVRKSSRPNQPSIICSAAYPII